jgi:uncharacterized protein (DUF342 family)
LTDRKNLLDIQDRLPKALQRVGFDIQRGDPAKGINKHIDTNKWKLQEASRLAQELSKLEADIEIRSASLKSSEEALKAKEGDLATQHQQLEKETLEVQQRLATVAKPGELLQISGRVKLKEPLFGDRHVELSVPDYNTLYNATAVAAKAVESVEPLKAEAAKVPALLQEVGSLRSKNMELTNKVRTLDKDLTNLHTKTYQKYQKRGLDDKQVAVAMMKFDGISKEVTAKTIASSSNSAPNMSNEARDYSKGIVTAALAMDSKAVALIARSAGEDWDTLSQDEKRAMTIEMSDGR